MAAVAQHQQPKAMSADELARSLRAHLERRGVLRGLTARLRRDITLEVRGQRGDGPQPSSSQQRLRDSVIAEALRTQHTGNAYAVFVPESSLGEERACLDSSELAEAVGPYASTALDKLIGRATTKTVDVETNTTIRPAGETLGDRLESVRRKFRALSKEKENIENEATLEAEATAAAIESAEAIVKAKRDADVEADYKRLHARYRDELDALSRNVRAVLQRESESREDAQSAAADRARADAARAEARKHEAQAERLQAQFAAAVADANAARSEVLHLREALVLQREDAASRARVQLAQAEFAAAERRKTEDERARASELADDLAGDSQVQLEPSRAGQLSSSEEAIGRRAAAAFRLAGRNRREAVSTTVVFEAPKDPVRALDAALAAGDAAERMRAQACAQLDAEVASNEELRSELRALRNLVDQSRGALDALAREPPSAFSRVHVVAKPPPPPPSRSVIEAGPPRFQLVDTRDLYASRRRAVPDDDDDGELAALQERRAKAIARAKADAEAAEAEAEASLRRREAALVARERAAAAAVYVSPPAAAAPPPTTVYVAPPRRRSAAPVPPRRWPPRRAGAGPGRRAAGARIAAGGRAAADRDRAAAGLVPEADGAGRARRHVPVPRTGTRRGRRVAAGEAGEAAARGPVAAVAAVAARAGRHARRRRRVERRRARGPGDLAADGGAPREGTPRRGPRGGGIRGDEGPGRRRSAATGPGAKRRKVRRRGRGAPSQRGRGQDW